jgi:hypothetical protein
VSNPYQAANETERSSFSSFQRIPANVSKADAKTKEVAEAAQAYLAKLQAEREAA